MRGSGGSGSGGGFADAFVGFIGSRLAATVLCVILLAVAGAHVFKALGQRYERYFDADPGTMKLVHPVAKAGLIARGLVFAVGGFMLALSAWQGSGEATPPGSADALRYIQSLPGGAWLLAATAVGLVAFAAYSFAEARFRRITVRS